MTAKKKKKGGGIFWKLLFLVALCVFCFSMYQLVNIYLGYKKGVSVIQLPKEKIMNIICTGQLKRLIILRGLYLLILPMHLIFLIAIPSSMVII